MATIDRYKLLFEIAGTEQLDSVTQKIGNLNRAVGIFSSVALAGLASSAMKFADGIMDVADSTGIAAGKIMALGTALRAAGGDAKDVGNIVNKFYQNLDEMASGSDRAEEALGKVGIGFEDLRTLSAEALLDKTISNLAQMEAGAKRTAAGIAIFGKSFAQIDPTKLEKILKTQDITALTRELQKIADINEQIETSYENLNKAAIKVINDLTGNTGDLTLSAEAAENAIKAVGYAMLFSFSLQTLTMIINITKGLQDLLVVLRGIAVVQKTLSLLTPGFWLKLGAGIAVGTAALFAFNDEAEKTQGLDLKDPELALKAYTAAAAGLARQVAAGTLSLEEYNKQIEMMRTAPGLPQTLNPTGAAPEAGPLTEQEVEAQRRVAAAEREQTKEMIKQASLQRDYQRELNKLIGDESTAANIKRERLKIELDYNSQIRSVQTEIANETAKGAEANKDQIVALNEKIAALKNIKDNQLVISAETIRGTDAFTRQTAEMKNMSQMQFEILNLQNQGVTSLDAYLNALGKVSTLRDNELIAIQKNTEYYNSILSIINRIADNLNATGDSLKNYDKINDLYISLTNYAEMLKQSLSDTRDVSANVNQTLKAQQQILEKYPELREKEGLFLLNLIALEATRHNISMNNIKAEQDANDARQQSVILGFQDAMVQLSKSLTPYQVAQDAIQQSWQTISSSLDTFVRDGKFKFRDFARSIVQDIGLMIAKMYLFQAIQLGARALGFTIPGLAGGGPVNKNMPYFVGEKGPELFVPSAPGRIIPNSQIGNVAAQGSNQAPSAPSGNTYITNNISAVDAKSVAQLFAENRKTMLGTIRMAEKEMPYA